jgi:hypothetical protein
VHRPGTRDDQGRLVVDVRGPRFGAAITTTVLGTALVVQGTLGAALLAWQVLAFGVASIAGLSWSPYGNLFRLLKRRLDLGPPPATEAEAPPRFAQACGLAVAGAGLVAVVLGATALGWSLVAVVLALSTLLATTGLCVGCELHVLVARLRTRTGAVGAR